MRRKSRGYEVEGLNQDGKQGVRTPAVIAAVVSLHIAVVGGAIFFFQGCATRPPKPVVVEQPGAPVMPPTKPPAAHRAGPVFQPPVPVEPAPAMLEPAAGETYVIKKGESLSTIAKRFGISWRELAEINSIADPNKIRAGQKLVLPSYSKGAAARPAKKAATPALSGSSYVVRRGDSLSAIAKQFGVKTRELAAANGISDPNRIKVGQKLVIPGAGTAAPSAPAPAPRSEPLLTKPVETPPAPAPVAVEEPAPASAPAPSAPTAAAPADEKPLDYTVLTGDTLEEIAKLFIVSKEDIMKLNDLSDESAIKPGMKLLIPPPDI